MELLRKLLLVLILPVSIFAFLAQVPLAHAYQIGVVCIALPGTIGCPSTPQIFRAPVGSSFTVQVNLFNSTYESGFDIILVVDQSILVPTGVALVPVSAGGLIRAPFIGSECVNGVAITGSCSPQSSQPGTVELGVIDQQGLNPSVPTTGALFTATFSVTGSTNGTTIGYATGCTGTSVANTCVFISNGSEIPDPETVETGIFATPDLTITPTPSSLTIEQRFSATSAIRLTSLGFSGSVEVSADVAPNGPRLSPSSIDLALPFNGEVGYNLTVSTSASTAAGSYTVTLTATATGGGLTHTSTITLTVTPFTGVVLSGGMLHWIHHLNVSTTGGVEFWTVVVNNSGSLSQNVTIIIRGTSSAGLYLESSPVTLVPAGKSSFSFTTPVNPSFVGTKVSFTATLVYGGNTSSTLSPVTKSGSFTVV